MKELVEACRANEVTDLIMVHEHRGVPGESLVKPPEREIQVLTFVTMRRFG